jgi:hypothetical protein
MATVSSAGGGTSMGNAQQGTRGLSAGDWIRLQRLRGARNNGTTGSDAVLVTNKDIAPTTFPQLGYNRSLMIRRSVGTSKIRRPASNWTDYVASQTADFVLSSQTATTGTSIKNTLTKLCNCTSSTLSTKVGNCTKCDALGSKTHVFLS